MKNGRIASDIGWASTAQVGNLIMSLLLVKIWATYLTPNEFGKMALLNNTASLLVGAFVWPFSQAILVQSGSFIDLGQPINITALAFRKLANAVFAVSAAVIGLGLTIKAIGINSAEIVAITGVVFLVESQMTVWRTKMLAERRQSKLAGISVLDSLLRLIFQAIALTQFSHTAKYAIAGQVIGGCLAITVVLGSSAGARMPNNAKSAREVEKRMVREVFQTAAPLIPNAILQNISDVGTRYLIALKLGVHNAGMYAAAYGIIKRPFGMLSDIGQTTMMPAYLDALRASSEFEMKRMKTLWLAGIGFLSLAGTLVFGLFGGTISLIFLSAPYQSAASLFWGLGFSTTLYNIIRIMQTVRVANNGSMLVLANNTIGVGFTMVLGFIFASKFQLTGVVAALLLGNLAQLLHLANGGKSVKNGYWPLPESRNSRVDSP